MSQELNYFAAAEHLWGTRNPARPRFTSLDWSLLSALENGGYPLEAILWGIERTFDNYKPKAPGDRVRHLAYCMGEIVACGELLAEDSTQGHGDLKKSLRRRFLGDPSPYRITGKIPAGSYRGSPDRAHGEPRKPRAAAR